jgi:hypothetical protein
MVKGNNLSELISWSDGIINLAGEPIFSFAGIGEKEKKFLQAGLQ